MLPQLRPLTVTPLGASPAHGVVVSDPLGVSPASGERGLELSPREWAVVRRFDGRATVEQVAASAAIELGEGLGSQEAQAIGRRLGELLLLQDPRFEREFEREFDTFRRLETRPFVGSGEQYEPEPFDLRVRVGGLVADDWDMPPLPQAQGLITPSGPIARAAPLYSRAWASVRHCRDAIDRIVVLGSLGAPLRSLLLPLSKPFDTPLGRIEPDREALAALGHLPGREQLAHRSHCALERQFLFLRVLFPETPVVPILVSGPRVDGDGELLDPDTVQQAVDGLAAIRALPGRTLIVAAADIWRMGRNGGAVAPAQRGAVLGGELGRSATDRDREAIDAATRLDHEIFLAAAEQDGDPARLALAAAPYLLLRTLEGAASVLDGSPVRGSTLGYLQMPAAGEITTAAAIVFH